MTLKNKITISKENFQELLDKVEHLTDYILNNDDERDIFIDQLLENVDPKLLDKYNINKDSTLSNMKLNEFITEVPTEASQTIYGSATILFNLLQEIVNKNKE